MSEIIAVRRNANIHRWKQGRPGWRIRVTRYGCNQIEHFLFKALDLNVYLYATYDASVNKFARGNYRCKTECMNILIKQLWRKAKTTL